MSGDEGSLREIRAALSHIASRLDQLTAGGTADPAPLTLPGEPLDEGARGDLAELRSVLAIGPDTTLERALVLALDRLIHRAGVDCAAVFIAGADGLRAVASVGFESAVPVSNDDAGTVGRAIRDGEAIRGGTGTARPDDRARALGLTHTLALPIPGTAEASGAALFAGRRRAVPFDAGALGLMTLVADRLGLVLASRRPRAPVPESNAALGLTMDLDLERVSTTIVAAAAERLGAPVVALFLPEAHGLVLAAGKGVPMGRAPADPTVGVLGAVLGSRTPWEGGDDAGDEALERALGAPARLVVPLLAGEQLVAVLAAGGRRAVAASTVAPILHEAAVAIRNARLYRDAIQALAETRAAPAPAPAPPPAQDFANLLAVVLGRLAVVRDRVEDPAVTRELDVAEEAAWRAAEVVRGLLGFAPGQRAGALKPLDLSAIIRDTAEETERRWAGREPRPPAVRLDLEAMPPVRGSAEDLREALEHVLENALESGHDEGPLTVRARWDGGGRIDITVEDHGTGMDDTVRRRALEPFFSTKGQGRLGLGLPVAQAIVARHHGELEITSAPGLGTTVRVVLPTVASGRRVGAGEPGMPARILIVEDELPVRDALVQALTQQGHLAHVAADGRAALAILQKEPLDAVVTDLALPGMSGLEVARAVKRLYPDMPVLLVTAWPGGPDPASLDESGVDAVIEKPVGLSEFRATLAVALARRGIKHS